MSSAVFSATENSPYVLLTRGMTLWTRCCTAVNRMLRRSYAIPLDLCWIHGWSFGSWLSGPPPVEPGTKDQGPNDYPGQRLGLPPTGPRSLARMGRRIAALFVDWLIAYGLAALAMTVGWVTAADAVDRRPGHLVRARCGVGAAVRIHPWPVRARPDRGARRRPAARRARPRAGARAADRAGHPGVDHRRRPAGTARQGDEHRGRAPRN